MFEEKITEEEAINQLKVQLQINDDSSMEDILGSFYLSDDTVYIYIYKIDRIYKKPDGEEIVYADEEQNLEAYKFARKFKMVKSDLEKIFIGKTEDEMIGKYKSGDLETTSDNINSIRFWLSENPEILGISHLISSLDDNEIDFCEYNSVYLIVNDEGRYSGIMIGAGN